MGVATLSPEKSVSNRVPESPNESPTVTESSSKLIDVIVESVQDSLLPLLLKYSVNARAIETTLEKLVHSH
jgi:hypothetical protein